MRGWGVGGGWAGGVGGREGEWGGRGEAPSTTVLQMLDNPVNDSEIQHLAYIPYKQNFNIRPETMEWVQDNKFLKIFLWAIFFCIGFSTVTKTIINIVGKAINETELSYTVKGKIW